MFGKVAVALLIVGAPALAQDTQPTDQGETAQAEAPQPVAYKTKKVCRSVEVVGSSIPRTSCTTKRVPIKPSKQEEADAGKTAPDSNSQQ
jgi:hypothetical protein